MSLSLSHGQAVFQKVPRSLADSSEGMNNVYEHRDSQAEPRSQSLHLNVPPSIPFRERDEMSVRVKKERDKEEGKEKQE